MAPSGVRRISITENIINAAVLILIFPINDIANTVFMKRAEYPGIHSGQISLPGGKEEIGDNNLEDTVLRETFEEIGVQLSKHTLVGKLTPLYIPVSGFKVYPFVGTTDEKPYWIPDKQEVTYLIETPLEELLDPRNIKHEKRKINGFEMDVPYFDIKGEKIWGATAMIMSEFLDVLRRFKLS